MRLAILLALGSILGATTRYAGPGTYSGQTAGQYATPCRAIAASSAGDVVYIDAATVYHDDTCHIPVSLTIHGWNFASSVAAMAVIDHPSATAAFASGGIWYVDAWVTATIDHVDISGGTVTKCGVSCSGIRVGYGGSLALRYSKIHDNFNGLLGDVATNGGDWLIEYTEFFRNGSPINPGTYHNLYVGTANSLTFRYNFSHNSAWGGHLLKTRARYNFLYNNLMLGMYGQESFAATKVGTELVEFNIPIGGVSYVVGNIVEQGPYCGAYSSGTGPLCQMSLVQFNNECTVSGRQSTHGRHPYHAFPLTADVTSGATTATVNKAYLYDMPGLSLSSLLPVAVRFETMAKLTSGMAAAATTLVLDDGRDFPSTYPYNVWVGDEEMQVASCSGSQPMTCTVVRAQSGTKAVIQYGTSTAWLDFANEDTATLTAFDTSTGVVTLTRGGSPTSHHSANPFAVITIPSQIDSEFHAVNNTLISSANGGWSNLQSPPLYGAFSIGISSPTNPGANPDCSSNTSVPARIYNNAGWSGSGAASMWKSGDVWNLLNKLGPAPPTPQHATNVTSVVAGDLTTWFRAPATDDTSSQFTGGTYDYRLTAGAAALIGTGTDMSGSTYSLPCGGPGLPDTCGENPAYYPLVLGRAARADSLDVGAMPRAAAAPTGITVSVSPSSLPVGSTATVTVTLPSTSASDANITFISSSEIIANKPNSIVIPAGSTAGTTSVTRLTSGAFSLSAIGSAGSTAYEGISGAVTPNFAITTAPVLPAGVVGTAYTQTLASTSGTGSITWGVLSGALPSGLALSSAGVLSGTPTLAGAYAFIITAADSSTPAQTASAAFTLTIAPAVVTTQSAGTTAATGASRAVIH